MANKFYETGFVLYEGKSKINGESIVAILTLKSMNKKTGNMAQLWLLHTDINPVKAVKTGKDESICGHCIFRHYLEGGCYVFVGQEPLTVWKAWKEGVYPKLPIAHYNILSGLSMRFGAYGDPFAIPVNILNELKKQASNYTGYTHQWKEESASELKSLCMASVDTIEEYEQATKEGWRTYRVIQPGSPLMPGEILCPHLNAGVQCKDCSLCCGTTLSAKNIVVYAHGSGKNKFNTEPVITNELEEIKAPPPLRNVRKIDIPQPPVNEPKIISSSELQKMQFECLDFTGKWNTLIGYPSVNFHCIVHGMSGHGKSTFVIQFAHYLAETSGRTLYISGEEGFSKTFKDKFDICNAGSNSLDVADLRTYEDIIRKVPKDKYNFICIDSLDTLKIDAVKLRKIKATFKNTALITISQATKAGDIRGSYEIVHDSDVAIEVKDGVATTTKNRFKEKGITFQVFEQLRNANPGNDNKGTQNSNPQSPTNNSGQIEDILTTWNNRLDEALASEDFEAAAKIRDEIERIKNDRNKNSNN